MVVWTIALIMQEYYNAGTWLVVIEFNDSHHGHTVAVETSNRQYITYKLHCKH